MSFAFEVPLMVFLQSFMDPVLIAAASFLTICGEEALFVGVLCFLYWVWNKDMALFLVTNVLAGTVLNPLIKNIVLRPRPYIDHDLISCLKPVHEGDIYDTAIQGYSFPSGHAMNATIFYGSFPVAVRRCAVIGGKTRQRVLTFVRVLAVLMPLLVGLSRVVLGVHYPTDVLAGYLTGVLVVLVLSALQKRMKNRALLYLILCVLALPGVFYCRTNDYFTCFGLMIGFFAANLFDERFVRFESTRNPPAIAFRLIVGGTCFYLLNTLLKLPFSEAFLSSASTGQFFVRFLRYMIVTFVMLGLYPALFRIVEERFLRKR